jgi:2-amino-4-hydroxy-6-hydroxymethyldihydropteridine diphosphokinase
MPVSAWIGIGANLGDARAAVHSAIERLAVLADSSLTARSSLYSTAPIDSAGDDYVNAVVRITTTLAPESLLRELQKIELDHGRERPYRNAPRTLDLDLLLYGEAIIVTPDLTVPHPRLHQRAFVLVPLLECDSGLVIPGLGPAIGYLSGVAEQAIAKTQ